ncbi:MAG: hypothetical protein B0A82_02890 [Alkalinema sp. CACIAM 70d]|nr:MAG: hypothetical protein B0A82_02890 [Alkalinema sp. CACIAM 70d]
MGSALIFGKQADRIGKLNTVVISYDKQAYGQTQVLSTVFRNFVILLQSCDIQQYFSISEKQNG